MTDIWIVGALELEVIMGLTHMKYDESVCPL